MTICLVAPATVVTFVVFVETFFEFEIKLFKFLEFFMLVRIGDCFTDDVVDKDLEAAGTIIVKLNTFLNITIKMIDFIIVIVIVIVLIAGSRKIV